MNINKSIFIQFTKQVEKLNSKDLLLSAKKAAKQEQNETLFVLAHLYEIDRRRLYAELEHSSLWAYAVKELGYASSSASERCESMRLMYGSSLAIEKIESGELNLTNALQLQRHFKSRKNKPTLIEKEELIKKACGKSTREVATTLLSLDPHALPKKEKIKQLTEELSLASFVIDEEIKNMVERYKELKGQQSKLKDIFYVTLKQFLENNDPLIKAKKALEKKQKKVLKKVTNENKTVQQKEKSELTALHSKEHTDQKIARAPERLDGHSRYRAKEIENEVQLRALGQCEYIAENGVRCKCRTRLEYDHIIPFALGGKTTTANTRLICKAHNLNYAIKAFGSEKMGKYLKNLN